MPPYLTKQYQRRNLEQNSLGDRTIPIEFDLAPNRQNNSDRVFSSSGLKYDGSFSRGFSAGNSQSLVLNSNFNLQLSGDIGNDMKISAAISDENLPIQPEGNTQLLQEFDRVYIQIDRKKSSIIAGDYEIRRPKSYFLNYFKRLQGIQIKTTQNEMGPFDITTSTNFAISKGKFARNNFIGQEGNQGPYRLSGNEGERIIKILAGTEKVFVDGVLLTRGLENDYTISYDRAEISFTDEFLITKDKRIIIEFEFADLSYVRSQYGASVDLKSEKLEINFNFYNEQDNKNTTGTLDLDDDDLQILSSIGDNLDMAFKDGSIAILNDDVIDRALYNKVFESTISDSILIYEPNQDSAQYIVNFSDVGQGNGSYVIDSQVAANGRAYLWVGPGLGSFEPVIRIVPPERRMMMSLGGKYQLSKNTYALTEFSLSNFDPNRFSSVDDDDNIGLGIFAGLGHEISLKGDQKLILSNKTEIKDRKFKFLNPYRDAEFTRNWNTSNSPQGREVLSITGIDYQINKQNQLGYRINNFLASTAGYSGNKHDLNYNLSFAGFRLNGITSLLLSEDFNDESMFLRPNISIEKLFTKWRNLSFGASYDGEDNEITSKATNQLDNRSAKYDYWKFFVSADPLKTLKLSIGTNKRNDWGIKNNEKTLATTADELETKASWIAGKQFRIDGNFIVRDLVINDADLTTSIAQRSILGGLDYSLKLFKDALSMTANYQIGSGQEPKREFEYVEVQRGEGQYIWLDNGDMIRQVNEFQISPVQDTANYVKVAIINNEFIRTDANNFNQTAKLDFRKLLNSKTNKVSKFLSRISAISNIRINHKTLNDGSADGPSFFKFDSQDTSLVSFQSAQTHTLFFNRGNPKYDIQFGMRDNENKLVQITGFEANTFAERFTRLRWNFNKSLDIILQLSSGNKAADSEFFDDNDYDYTTLRFAPQVIYRPTNKLRFMSNYSYNDRANRGDLTPATARSHEFGLETTFRKSNKLNLTTSVEYVKVAYDGPTNTVLQLSMLEGLQDGNNFLWSINATQRLSGYLDMIIGYDGRKTGTARTIHTARMQIRATF